MSLTQVLPTDSFSQVINKLNQTIAFVSSLSPSSLEIISVSSPADNELLRYNNGSGFFENIAIAGTSNQVTVTHGAGTLTISAPQDIHTGATPTFAGLTLATALSIGNGGTGQTTAQNARNALLPTQSGNGGKYLQTDGTNVSWAAVTAGATGADTQIIFNDGGSFGTSSTLTFNKTTYTLSAPFVGATGFTASTSITSPFYGATGSIVIRPGFDGATGFRIQNAAGSSTVFTVDTSNVRIGIGTESPSQKLDVAGNINVSTGSDFRINGSVVLSASVLNVGAAGAITGVLQTAAQPNVTSVGTLTSLTVNGAVGLTGTVTVTGNLTAASNTISASILTATGTSTAIESSGDVLIKTAKSLKLNNTANTFSVSLKAAGGLASNITWTLPTSNGLNGYYLQTDGAGNLSWIAGATGSAPVGGVDKQVQFNDGGSIAGATGFTYDKTNMDIHVGRNVVAGGSFIANSDIALKEDIITIPNSMSILHQIEGRKYFRKDLHIQQHGVIAQEIQPILPELVHLNGNYLAVDYLQFIPILIEAVKELDKRIKN